MNRNRADRLSPKVISSLLGAAMILAQMSPLFGRSHWQPSVSSPIGEVPVANNAAQKQIPAPNVPTKTDPDMPEVRLNQLVYEDGTTITATIRFRNARQMVAVNDVLVLATPNSKDVETLRLIPSGESMVFRSASAMAFHSGRQAGSVKPMDGTLVATPNELILALYAYSPTGDLKDIKSGRFAADFGVAADPNNKSAQVRVDPRIDVDGKLGVGTLASRNGIVQVALDQLLFHPTRPEDLQNFLQRTQGKVVRTTRSAQKDNPSWYVVSVTPKPEALKYFSQLRELVGDKVPLGAGSQSTLNLYAYALELNLDGYRVALHPRITFAADLATSDGSAASPINAASTDPADSSPSMASSLFGVREAWGLLAMFDYDTEHINAAFLDNGFAPNPDFRGAPDFIERDMTAGGRRGPGAAVGVPTVGASLFGDRIWHGNGTVTIAGGVLNNGFGSVGTGGQVVFPMLYKFGLVSYALDIDAGIRNAVDDGADIINISAGYPCRLLWFAGPDNICSIVGRELFATKIGLALFAVAGAICATLGLIPFVGPVICSVALALAATALAAALVLFPFLGDVRGAMEEAVDYAVSRGVPVVANSGNRIANLGSSLGPFADWVETTNTNTDEWQVIPGAIPQVINCAAAAATTPFQNRHMWGNAVDIWAPIRSRYWGPSDPDHVGEVSSQTERGVGLADGNGLGGTSAAAPYVTGVIANMMAVNRRLRRSTAPESEIRNIVRNVTEMLVGQATLPGRLGLPMDSDPTVMAVDRVEVGRRRNMVNAFRPVRAASGPVILSYWSLGYDTDLGLATPGRAGDSGADTAAAARDVHGHPVGDPAFISESHGMVEETFTDEIPYIRPSPPRARSPLDQDWYLWATPSAPGVYTSTVTLTIPATEETGSILVNGASGTFTSVARGEKTFTFETGELFENSRYRLNVRGLGTADSLYKLRIGPAVRTASGPMSDRFDAGPDNNEIDRATPLGSGVLGWREVEPSDSSGIRESRAFAIDVPDLTIHASDDVDWFSLPVPPMMPASCDVCAPSLAISIEPPSGNSIIEVYSSDGTRRPDGTLNRTLLASGQARDPLTLGCAEYQGRFPLLVRVRQETPSPLNYTLRFRWSIPSATLCSTISRIVEAHEGEGGSGGPRFRDLPPSHINFLWGSRLFDPYELLGEKSRPRPADSLGRVLLPSLYFLDWKGGDFNLRALGDGNQSLLLELYALDGKLLGQAGTSDLSKESKNGARGVGGGMVATDLNARNLGPGQYIMSLSHMKQGDELMVFLPRGAIHNGTPGFEDLLKPSQARPWRMSAYERLENTVAKKEEPKTPNQKPLAPKDNVKVEAPVLIQLPILFTPADLIGMAKVGGGKLQLVSMASAKSPEAKSLDWYGMSSGDQLTLSFDMHAQLSGGLYASFLFGPQGGSVRVLVNGQEIREPVELTSTSPSTEKIQLGKVDFRQGTNTVTFVFRSQKATETRISLLALYLEK